MDLKIKNQYKIEIFTTIFQTIKSIAEHIVIHFTEDRMFIQTMDSSKISVLEITILSSWFDFYSCQQNNIKIGINTGILYKLLQSKEKSQTIHFEYNGDDDDGGESNNDKLFVNMEYINEIEGDNKIKNVYNRYFEVPLINLENELMEIPDIEYEAEMSLPSVNFAILMHQLKGFGDILNIKCNESNIQFISKSLESGSMRVEIKMDELNEFSIIENENINVSFGLNYLNTISAYSKISKMVEIKIRRDYPIRIDYIFGDIDESGDNTRKEGSVKFFLSPKMDNDDSV